MGKNQKNNRLTKIRSLLKRGDINKIAALAGVHRVWVCKVFSGDGVSERVLRITEIYLDIN